MEGLPDCMNIHYKDSLDHISKYVIPVGTVLYTGGFKDLSADPTHFRFFSKNKDVAANFARTAVLEKKTPMEIVSVFKVIRPITIYLQDSPTSAFYFDTKEAYASEEAQCLCKGDYHGYATADAKYEIEDIGLCGVGAYLQKITIGGRRKKTRRLKKKSRKRRNMQ